MVTGSRIVLPASPADCIMPSVDSDPPLAPFPLEPLSRARAAGLRVAVVDRHGRPATVRGLASWLVRTMPANVRGLVTIALVSDQHMRSLNRTYRGADYATDVLSFPDEGEPSVSGGAGRTGRRVTRPAARPPRPERRLGDVVIATGVAARQAHAQGHSVGTELRVLALHGLLHLLGYDHDVDAGRMAAAERRLRRRGRLSAGLIERHPS